LRGIEKEEPMHEIEGKKAVWLIMCINDFRNAVTANVLTEFRSALDNSIFIKHGKDE
jgi:hypothetical protein